MVLKPDPFFLVELRPGIHPVDSVRVGLRDSGHPRRWDSSLRGDSVTVEVVRHVRAHYTWDFGSARVQTIVHVSDFLKCHRENRTTRIG